MDGGLVTQIIKVVVENPAMATAAAIMVAATAAFAGKQVSSVHG